MPPRGGWGGRDPYVRRPILPGKIFFQFMANSHMLNTRKESTSSYTGTVIHGIGSGHKGWSLRTANIRIEVSLGWGFYVCDVYRNEENLGRGLVIALNWQDARLIEVYISKHEGSLYGETIHLDGLEKLSTEELEGMVDRLLEEPR